MLQRNAAIDPVHSSTCPTLSFSTGALYSRKVTLEGEEVSLQIQDTPCVALQVTNGGTEAAHRYHVSSWMEKVNVGCTDILRKNCCHSSQKRSQSAVILLKCFCWAKLKKKRPFRVVKNALSCISILVRNVFEVRGQLLAHDEFNECNVPHGSPHSLQNESLGRSFPPSGEDNDWQRKSFLEGWWASKRLERNNQCVEAQRSRWSRTPGRFRRLVSWYYFFLNMFPDKCAAGFSNWLWADAGVVQWVRSSNCTSRSVPVHSHQTWQVTL